jgi:cobyrinic acid a,c-diamide synthase
MARSKEAIQLAKAIVVAAPASGSGKTLVTLGVLRALRDAGYSVASAKIGPDYIDPAFHAMATGLPCPSLDLWAMGADRCRSLLAQQATQADVIIVEGVMGLFDGPHGAEGSTADAARELGLPVVLVVDCQHQAQSIAALVHGFSTFRRDVAIAGLILNRVASDRHEMMLRLALDAASIPVVGVLRRDASLQWPSRHLGLVQANEQPTTEPFIARASSTLSAAGIPERMLQLASLIGLQDGHDVLLPPPGQRIAVACDAAFSFSYPSMLQDWRQQGAEILPFSPLADESADGKADVVLLPGGYPELHAGRLSANRRFLKSVRQSQALVYGECGGYMVLGETIIDAEGNSHAMAGLLPLVTSFRERKLQLGYRRLVPAGGPWKMPLRAHEFHYSVAVREGKADPLFAATDIAGHALGNIGMRCGRVMGSYAHVIASEAA